MSFALGNCIAAPHPLLPSSSAISAAMTHDAKASFAAAMLLPGQSKFLRRDFQNNAAGQRSLQQWLAKHSRQSCLAGMEVTGNYGWELLNRLHEDGHRCSLLQPRQVKSHMLARGQGNKTDCQDANDIAHFISVHNPRQWLTPNAQRRQLKELFQVLVALKTDLKRHKNRLAAAPGEQARQIKQLQVKVGELTMGNDFLGAYMRSYTNV